MFGTATDPVPPFWFKQRQGKVEQMEESSLFKLSAPNQQDAYVQITETDGKWSALVRLEPEGENVAETGADFENPGTAWNAAFELYRQAVIV